VANVDTKIPSLADFPLPSATPDMHQAGPEMFDLLQDDSFRTVPGTEAAEVRDLKAVRKFTGGDVAAIVTRVAPGATWEPTAWHMTSNSQIAYVTRGWIDFEFEDLGVVRLKQGDSMLLPARCRHRETEVSPDYEIIQVLLPRNSDATIWKLDPETAEYRNFVIEDVSAALFQDEE
jgi:quercetin dioxygenase-like cupin family protein